MNLEKLKTDNIDSTFNDNYRSYNDDESMGKDVKYLLDESGFNIKNINSRDFSAALSVINDVVTNGGNKEFNFNATDTEYIDTDYGIRKEYRDFVMENCLNAVQTLPKNEGAALFYYIFLKTHPFKDGNGRTARIFSDVIREKDSVDDIIKDIGHNGDYGQKSDSQSKLKKDRNRVDFAVWDLFINSAKNIIVHGEEFDTVDINTMNGELDVDKIKNSRLKTDGIWLDYDANEALFMLYKDKFENGKNWKNQDAKVLKTGEKLNYDDVNNNLELVENLQDGIKLSRIEVVIDLFVNPGRYVTTYGGESQTYKDVIVNHFSSFFEKSGD